MIEFKYTGYEPPYWVKQHLVETTETHLLISIPPYDPSFKSSRLQYCFLGDTIVQDEDIMYIKGGQ